jgi:betaine-aldehyde dehydrogenase
MPPRTRRSSRGCLWIDDHTLVISEMPYGVYNASGFGKDMAAVRTASAEVVAHVVND